ncbi:MAG: hypothetical protein QF393_10955 [Rhodospirillales bacterium]|jgi:hypothetical protein|nr:hypothetical protein [Rhodospirillaceae bacterium]MDP6428524.1 hypothetical protein [Rhodospirillales bacterium]|tara:strand:- start:143 stop:454 length:312 start_codon:yes stop_codon:yes gene_type:complete
MKAMMLLTGNGALVILTSYEKVTTPSLLEKLAAKGIEKFIAYEIPLELAKQRYGGHFGTVMGDVHETDDLRVLDFNGDRAFRMFHFDELGPPVAYQSDAAKAA